MSTNKRPNFELQHVFYNYFDQYAQKHSLSKQQLKVVSRILKCRTLDLGAHTRQCDQPDCDYTEISANSCRDRHCPKCQSSKKIRWVEQRMDELLNVPYYHVVFTIPHLFNTLFLYNKAVLYDLFFQAASKTLDQFGQQYLNGKPGYVGILHTWGQNLGAHIHIHFIVAGGALSHRHDQWIRPPYEAKFLFPVLQMSKVFRGIFIKKIKRIYKKADLSFPEDLDYLSNPELFEQFLDQAVSRRWHVYAKAPFGGPLHMIKYLSSYVHRIAISNFRLKQINNGQITFTYKDYKDHCKIKSLTLSADEFIRRFLLHILPPKFKKIRFFGFMANHLRRKYCQLLRSLLGDNENNPKSLENNRDSHKNSCPICKKGLLVFKVLLKPWEIDDTMICWDTS